MACVKGKLGKKIEELMDESDRCYNAGDFDRAIALYAEAWDELPDGKYEYDESFLIVWGILDIAIEINNTEVMKQWVDKIFKADLERIDTGERELWAGKVAYECGEDEKALAYFETAQKKAGGYCFAERDRKYQEFFEMSKRFLHQE